MNILTTVADERVANVRCDAGRLTVDLEDGRTIAVPLDWYPRLRDATPEQLANWHKAGGGYGIHWPDLDEDLSTEGLLRGAPAPAARANIHRNSEDDLPLATAFDSSAVERARYHPGNRTLDIWYKGGDRYSYFDVPEAVYRALREAPSVGEYVNLEIKSAYRYELEPGRRRFRPG
jgi:hypothetical protein